MKTIQLDWQDVASVARAVANGSSTGMYDAGDYSISYKQFSVSYWDVQIIKRRKSDREFRVFTISITSRSHE